jgi:hypothetical protein
LVRRTITNITGAPAVERYFAWRKPCETWRDDRATAIELPCASLSSYRGSFLTPRFTPEFLLDGKQLSFECAWHTPFHARKIMLRRKVQNLVGVVGHACRWADQISSHLSLLASPLDRLIVARLRRFGFVACRTHNVLEVS